MSCPAISEGGESTKILSLGSCQTHFVARLYSEMKRRYSKFQFDICDYSRLGEHIGYDEQATFTRLLHSPRVRGFNIAALRAMTSAPLSGHFYRRVARAAVCCGLAPRAMLHAAATAVQINRFAHEALVGQHYDIWHFHFCTADSLHYLDVAPMHTNVVCSFWGSDLLRHSGLDSYWCVSNALERADAITTQSVELREIILSKFGRHLRPKIRCCRFPADAAVYHRISALCQQGPGGREAAGRTLNLPNGRVIVGIGHNGSSGNKHLDILAGLSRLPDSIKRRVFLVLPMTYGWNSSYAEAVEAACRQHGFDYVILREFLDSDAMAALRVATNILIFMPESDALSGSALETVYAGNVLVAGSWLPYGPYRRLGLPFVEAEDYHQLSSIIPSLLDRPRVSGSELAGMQTRIEGDFLADGTVPAWISMYWDLTQHRQPRVSS